MVHRKLSNEQKAAHILLPVLVEELAVMRTELKAAELHQGQADRSNDARSDWREFAMRAQQRVEGAARLVERVRDLAKGGAG